MSFNDSCQSQVCSFENVGLAETSSFGGDGDETLMRFSPDREDKLKEMLSLIPHDIRPKVDRMFRIFVKEEVELAHKNQPTTSMHGAGNFESRSLELMFSNNITSGLLTGEHIKGRGGVPLAVTLVDSRTKEEVKSGPEASGRVEIGVREGEVDGFTGENGRNKCESILVRQMEGNRSTRVAKICLNLIEGTALFPSVSFAHNKKWMKNSKIRLEARFVDNCNGIQVKEALTEPFSLKDRRAALYKKHTIPSLHDEVWRLYNIGRKGTLARSLRQAKIETVKDFLVCVFLHPQHLREIFDREKHAKSLTPTVKHAQTCPAKLKYCSSFEPKLEVVFNVSGEVLGLYLEGQFLSSNILSVTQKEDAMKLVISAFENWGEVVSVDDDQFVEHSSPSGHRLAETDTFDKNIILDGLDLHINESCLFDNMLFDGKHPNDPDFLPESLRTRYHEIYRGFESVYTSNPHEPDPVFGLVGAEAARSKRFCRR